MANENESKQQSSAANAGNDDYSNDFEEKLPEQIRDHILLEGVNSSELLQNTDIVNFANILSTLRLDLSTLLNEEIDEFQFQTICQDLLEKTSETIKLKPEKASKSQMRPPTPKSQQINLDDIYNHLKRQPWQYPHHVSPKPSEGGNDALSSDSEDQKTPHATVGENAGEVMMGFCDAQQLLLLHNGNPYPHPHPNHSILTHNAHDSGTPSSLELTQQISTLQPGSHSSTGHDHHDMKMDDDEEDSDEHSDEQIEQGHTLMGCCDKNAIQFNLPQCYQEIFHENVNTIMRAVKSKSDSAVHKSNIETPTLGNDGHQQQQQQLLQQQEKENEKEEDHTNDEDDPSFLECNHITMMGAIGSDAIQ